jgi:hypothetical protein
MASSPKIVDDSWGSLQIENHGSFKDAKLWPGGAKEWDWSKTGTEHFPGIQPEDAEELISHGARVVILSTGRNKRLGVPEETVSALSAKGTSVEVYSTEDAIKRYNELADDHPVGALIHSTC